MSQTYQRCQPSGELYCLEYDDATDQIIGALGPLSYRDLADDYTTMGTWDVPYLPPDDAKWANRQLWGYPLTLAEIEELSLCVEPTSWSAQSEGR